MCEEFLQLLSSVFLPSFPSSVLVLLHSSLLFYASFLCSALPCFFSLSFTLRPNNSPEMLNSGRVGIVFEFPERYFVADIILDEIIFAWPRQRGGLQLRELLASRLQKVMTSVGLTGISLDEDPQSLNGGYKHRLALAIQLVQTPNVLVLHEPLAGLDWKARADVKLLKDLKKELTFLVVSHDLE
ncbi:ABC transporter I family member 11, chloroplastic-like [Primulina eburnea]|uniref:ABC transporter I family member 11, chloroplastic-like n=1 Tax=Primulina eburnea TaxID=1245227 RepID=UPI003C6C20A8